MNYINLDGCKKPNAVNALDFLHHQLWDNFTQTKGVTLAKCKIETVENKNICEYVLYMVLVIIRLQIVLFVGRVV